MFPLTNEEQINGNQLYFGRRVTVPRYEGTIECDCGAYITLPETVPQTDASLPYVIKHSKIRRSAKGFVEDMTIDIDDDNYAKQRCCRIAVCVILREKITVLPHLYIVTFGDTYCDLGSKGADTISSDMDDLENIVSNAMHKKNHTCPTFNIYAVETVCPYIMNLASKYNIVAYNSETPMPFMLEILGTVPYGSENDEDTPNPSNSYGGLVIYVDAYASDLTAVTSDVV
tara:strand:- start:21927 stop:22613 length:687 start_codon:yes stop_codon:yes gene_type:complete